MKEWRDHAPIKDTILAIILIIISLPFLLQFMSIGAWLAGN